MKLIAWNVNGIRACSRKGFLEYLKSEDPDIVCLQETKATVSDLEDAIAQPMGYRVLWHSAEKKGYSGVAVFVKDQQCRLESGLGIERYDVEGRVVSADFGDYIVFGVYFPNGQRDQDRLNYKLDFYEDFFARCNTLRAEGKHVIVCGDYNTAHTEIDLANPKANQNMSGFLPVERAWMDRLVQEGYVDTFRHFCSEPQQYSWWTYRFGARKRNVGWRIDYVWVNKAFLPFVKSAFIQQDVLGSDHCPVGITFDHAA